MAPLDELATKDEVASVIAASTVCPGGIELTRADRVRRVRHRRQRRGWDRAE